MAHSFRALPCCSRWAQCAASHPDDQINGDVNSIMKLAPCTAEIVIFSRVKSRGYPPFCDGVEDHDLIAARRVALSLPLDEIAVLDTRHHNKFGLRIRGWHKALHRFVLVFGRPTDLVMSVCWSKAIAPIWCRSSQDVESPGGISPPGAPRTVRDPLESHGSRCSAVAMT
jgi:hypothetical protein